VLVVDFVDGANAWVIKGGSRLRLSFEARQSLCILSDIVGQELQGDKAVQFYILSLIDDTHPSAAEFLDDAVMRDSLADHGAQKCYVYGTAKSIKGIGRVMVEQVSC
jgi:hypothetical protein